MFCYRLPDWLRNNKTGERGRERKSCQRISIDPSLCKLWEKFLCRKDFFVVSNTSGICFEHFESRFIKKNEGSTRVDLDYSLFPIPSIHTTPEILLNPSLKPLISTPRKPPTKRPIPYLDQSNEFAEKDSVTCLQDVTPDSCPPKYSHQITEEKVVMTNIIFQENDALMIKTITIDNDLHVIIIKKGLP